MPEWFIDIFKIGGVSALMFFVFFLYHKSSSRQLETIITNTFQILSKMIEQNSLQLTYLQDIKTLVSNNLWCPMVKKITNEKEGKN